MTEETPIASFHVTVVLQSYKNMDNREMSL